MMRGEESIEMESVPLMEVNYPGMEMELDDRNNEPQGEDPSTQDEGKWEQDQAYDNKNRSFSSIPVQLEKELRRQEKVSKGFTMLRVVVWLLLICYTVPFDLKL